MFAIGQQTPPCFRFAPPLYQASTAGQQWDRLERLLFGSDPSEDVVRHAFLSESIGAPPGLEQFGPGSHLQDAPCVPVTPPPLPVPRFASSYGLLPLKCDQDAELSTVDSDSFDSESQRSDRELYPHRPVSRSIFETSSEDSASVSDGHKAEENLAWLSKGSRKHSQGKCTPCHFFHRKPGCTNGAKCRYCHLHEEMRDQPRPHKKKREKAKKAVDEWEQQECDFHTKVEIAARLATKDSYTRMILQRRLKDMDNEAEASFKETAIEKIDRFADFRSGMGSAVVN